MVSVERIELPLLVSETSVLPLDETEVATLMGLKPMTYRATADYSNHLNYRAIGDGCGI